jgi:hypothetical protein
MFGMTTTSAGMNRLQRSHFSCRSVVSWGRGGADWQGRGFGLYVVAEITRATAEVKPKSPPKIGTRRIGYFFFVVQPINEFKHFPNVPRLVERTHAHDDG